MASIGAAGVKQEVVKIPQNEAWIAFRRAQPIGIALLRVVPASALAFYKIFSAALSLALFLGALPLAALQTPAARAPVKPAPSPTPAPSAGQR